MYISLPPISLKMERIPVQCHCLRHYLNTQTHNIRVVGVFCLQQIILAGNGAPLTDGGSLFLTCELDPE